MENPFLRPSKISGPPAEKPVALERKGVKEAKFNETKHVSGNSEMKPVISDSIRNHSEKIGQAKPQEMVNPVRNSSGALNPASEQRGITSNGVKKKDSFPPIREGTKIERPSPMVPPPNTEPKKILENQDRNALGNIGQNQAEKRNQSDSIQSLPQPREGKVLNERQSLPKGGLFSNPDSKGQVIQQHRGTKGGLLEGFSGKSFR